MPHLRPALSGCVLVGGRSSRFGSNKAFALIEGESLVERAVGLLHRFTPEPYLVAKDPGPYADLGLRVVDHEGPQSGPVAGWKAALEAASTPWVLVLSVDMPYLTTPVVRGLIPETPPKEPQAYCYARSETGGVHPFPGLYHRDLAGHAAALGPAPAMRELLGKFHVNANTPPADADRVLSNINRPADFH